MKKVLSALVLCSFSLLSIQCAHEGGVKTGKKGKETWPLCGNRLTVGIDQFKTEDISFDWWNDDIALNSREIAVDELVNSPCFRVVERESRSLAPAGVMNEKALARSQEARKSRVAKKKGLKVADYLVTYAITAVMKGEESIGMGILSIFASAALSAATDSALGIDAALSSDKLHLTCRVINTATSEIRASASVKIKKTNVGLALGGLGGSGSGFGAGGLEYFKKTKVGVMVQNAVNQCSMKLAKSLVADGTLYEQVPLLSESVSPNTR